MIVEVDVVGEGVKLGSGGQRAFMKVDGSDFRIGSMTL